MTRNVISENETAWAAQQNSQWNRDADEGVVSGCAVTKGTGDWDADIASGEIWLTGRGADVSAQTEDLNDPTSDMSSGEERLVIVTVDSDGNSNSVEGTAVGSNPVSPDIPADEVILATIHVENGDSTLADSDIFDSRSLFTTHRITEHIMASLGG